jgi:hypothetical protein
MRTDSPKSITFPHWDWTCAIFWCDIEASVDVRFFDSFPRKSIILAFKHMVAEALGEFWLRCWGFGEHAFTKMVGLGKATPSPSNAWWPKLLMGLRGFLQGLMRGANWASFESGPSWPFMTADCLGPMPQMVGTVFYRCYIW